MKKTILLFVFAISSIMAFANNTDPVKNTGEKNTENVPNGERVKIAEDAQCTYCTACAGYVLCVSCNCTPTDCDPALEALADAFCVIAPRCCFGN